MKRLLISALAILGMGAIANAQFSVLDKDGNVLFTMAETPAYVEFNYYAPTGTENGHDWVDLGLPSKTLWATCNVGANTPDAYGSYFAWSETETKSNYNWNSYKYMDSSINDWNGCTKYTFADGQDKTIWYDADGKFIGDNKTVLDTDDDVAATWGGKWQMPTAAMMYELRNNCYWVWTTTYKGNSVNGYIVYKAKEGKDKGMIVVSEETPSSQYNEENDIHIFLPVAGYYSGSFLRNDGSEGRYWTNTLYSNYSDYASYFAIRTDKVIRSYGTRYEGCSVRPVCPRFQK